MYFGSNKCGLGEHKRLNMWAKKRRKSSFSYTCSVMRWTTYYTASRDPSFWLLNRFILLLEGTHMLACSPCGQYLFCSETSGVDSAWISSLEKKKCWREFHNSTFFSLASCLCLNYVPACAIFLYVSIMHLIMLWVCVFSTVFLKATE